jgi:hypothetical protein
MRRRSTSNTRRTLIRATMLAIPVASLRNLAHSGQISSTMSPTVMATIERLAPKFGSKRTERLTASLVPSAAAGLWVALRAPSRSVIRA